MFRSLEMGLRFEALCHPPSPRPPLTAQHNISIAVVVVVVVVIRLLLCITELFESPHGSVQIESSRRLAAAGDGHLLSSSAFASKTLLRNSCARYLSPTTTPCCIDLLSFRFHKQKPASRREDDSIASLPKPKSRQAMMEVSELELWRSSSNALQEAGMRSRATKATICRQNSPVVSAILHVKPGPFHAWFVEGASRPQKDGRAWRPAWL